MQRTPIKKRRSKPRRGPMRDAKYRAFVRTQPCAVAVLSKLRGGKRCFGLTQAAHTENNGMSSKGPDSSCAPLCCDHHAEYDAGRERFERRYLINMKNNARVCYERYLQERAA